MRKLRAWVQRYRRLHDHSQFQPVPDPAETYSEWDQRLGVAWIAGLLLIGLSLGYLMLAAEVVKWWIAIISTPEG